MAMGGTSNCREGNFHFFQKYSPLKAWRSLKEAFRFWCSLPSRNPAAKLDIPQEMRRQSADKERLRSFFEEAGFRPNTPVLLGKVTPSGFDGAIARFDAISDNAVYRGRGVHHHATKWGMAKIATFEAI